MGSVLPILSNVAIEVVATSAGNANKLTAISTSLGQTDGYYVGMTLSIQNSSTVGLISQQREIVGYIASTGTVILASPFNAQVPNGTDFQILYGRPSGASAAPLAAVTGYATSAGTTTTLIDTARTEATSFWLGATLIMTSGANAGLSSLISAFTNGTNTITVDPAFPNATASADTYIISSLINDQVVAANDTGATLTSQVLGNKADTAAAAVNSINSSVAYLKAIWNATGGAAAVETEATAGSANYFAGEVTVISYTPAVVTTIKGVKVALNNFVSGASITVRVYVAVKGTSRLIYQQVISANNPPYPLAFPVENSGDTIGTTGSPAYKVSLQSNNASDTAVAVDYQYTTKAA